MFNDFSINTNNTTNCTTDDNTIDNTINNTYNNMFDMYIDSDLCSGLSRPLFGSVQDRKTERQKRLKYFYKIKFNIFHKVSHNTLFCNV